MKFLCVLCDDAMKLTRVEEPGDGSLSVVFECGGCGHQMAMLTNPWETQLVRALDVKIGERGSPAGPMEFVRRMVATGREAGAETAGTETPGSAASPSKCPFSALVNLAAEKTDTERRGKSSAEAHPVCEWSPEAERRLERIPEFIRPMVRVGIEKLAAERGYRLVTEAVMEEARTSLGM